MSTTTNLVEPLFGGQGRWCIDTTMAELSSDSLVVDVRGWIAMPLGQHFEGPFLDDGTRRHLHCFARPDVERELPGFVVTGFDEVIDVARLVAASGRFSVLLGDEVDYLELPAIDDGPLKAARLDRRRSAITQQIRGLLACPQCSSPVEHDGETLTCAHHGAVGRNRGNQFELLPPDDEPLALTPPFSANAYDTEPVQMIAELANGLVLDDGCGLRIDGFDNVVNLNLSPFPLTDVIGSCAQLPFQNNSFDGLISVAVLEHVPNPARCVDEMARVFKPGATVYAAVPFLQPYHGYPHHYFNMTRDGMRTLFNPLFEVEDLYTPYGGLPMRTLSWFLDSYLRGLPERERAAFSKLTVGELAGDPEVHLPKGYGAKLSPTAVEELASVNVLIGRKR